MNFPSLLHSLRIPSLAGWTFVALALLGCQPRAVNADLLRVGVLQYGTVNWELQLLQDMGLDQQAGIELEIVPLASDNALAVALQAGRVDLIVSDWIWAARQRSLNRDYQFAPYSLAVGALMVNPAADIRTLEDMAGKKLGIAGGPVDKMWVLLRAFARHETDWDMARLVEESFAAPPLLNEMMLRGQVSMAINFWHYNARLEAAGMVPLFTMAELVERLGVEQAPPLLGWIFRADWATAHPDDLSKFLQATFAAKAELLASDNAWSSLRDLIRPENDAVLEAIKRGYREGIPQHYGEAEIAAAQQLFAILAEEGGAELVGDLDALPTELFWPGFRLP